MLGATSCRMLKVCVWVEVLPGCEQNSVVGGCLFYCPGFAVKSMFNLFDANKL